MTAVVIRGDARQLPLPDASADLIVTSPPYFGLRSYTDGGQHYDGQIGSEAAPREWLAAMLDCTREWVRILKPSGSIFVNLGDKYSGAQAQNDGRAARVDSADFWQRTNPKNTGIPAKSLMGLPWRYALACMDDLGLILRRDIIWAKPNGLPESVTDRCRSSHEYLFHLVKQPRYYAAVDEIREPHADASFRRARPGQKDPGRRPAGIYQDNPGQTLRLDQALNPLGKLPGSVWEIPSQPLTVPDWLGVDHFAAFPMELPRRIILGWSPPGICVACGEGRRPLAVTDLGRKERLTPAYTDAGVNGSGRHGKGMSTLGSRGTSATITGYACACPQPDAPTRPAIVVDPFGGTGTTALVASMHGRVGVSVDLSADYCRLANWRTRDPAERAKALQVPKPPPVPDGQDSLFDLEAV